ncbi:MAG: ankyrin repeat domain-containing protein, partial [Rhodospirillales bacterium]|nr:ankyrin repeat domain-containing protein [Rhodospirillales bacterium]
MVVASKSGDVDALRRALAAGGDPETLDGEGWTPIMNACYVGDHSEMVSILLEKTLSGSSIFWIASLFLSFR